MPWNTIPDATHALPTILVDDEKNVCSVMCVYLPMPMFSLMHMSGARLRSFVRAYACAYGQCDQCAGPLRPAPHLFTCMIFAALIFRVGVGANHSFHA